MDAAKPDGAKCDPSDGVNAAVGDGASAGGSPDAEAVRGGGGCFAGVRAYGGYVLARRIDPPRSGLILLTAEQRERELATSVYAVVFSVGDRVKADVVPGDGIVLFQKWGGYEVEINDHPFVFLKEEHIGLVIRD